MKPTLLFLPGLLWLWLSPAFAGLSPDAVETEAHGIDQLLMAPCCWGGTVAEHSSEASMNVKREVREMLAAGKSRAEILAAFERKYGERVLAMPKASAFGVWVWILPVVLLAAGLAFVTWVLRRWRKAHAQAPVPAPAKADAPSPVDAKYRAEIDRELYGA
jgi:cytochrome c-type biogenesis protein CcmH